jgi:hypothetical protein
MQYNETNVIALGVPVSLQAPVHVHAHAPTHAHTPTHTHIPALQLAVREAHHDILVKKMADDVLMRHAKETELAALYDAIVQELLNKQDCSRVRLIRNCSLSYEIYNMSTSRLQTHLNERLFVEHGIELRNLCINRQRRCVHELCDCGCTDCAVPCVLWNIVCACIPLIYWIPRIYGCIVEDDWCVTANVIVSI